jgi:hypothetical protein
MRPSISAAVSTFSNATAILKPDSWLTLARESGSLSSRDRHCGLDTCFYAAARELSGIDA